MQIPLEPQNCGQARVLRAIQIPIEPQNRGQLLMKTAIKHQNDEFLVITLKHVNFLGTPKLRTIAHETATKHENKEFLFITLKHVSGLTDHANPP